MLQKLTNIQNLFVKVTSNQILIPFLKVTVPKLHGIKVTSNYVVTFLK